MNNQLLLLCSRIKPRRQTKTRRMATRLCGGGGGGGGEAKSGIEIHIWIINCYCFNPLNLAAKLELPYQITNIVWVTDKIHENKQKNKNLHVTLCCVYSIQQSLISSPHDRQTTLYERN